jgi:hypothetical protein
MPWMFSGYDVRVEFTFVQPSFHTSSLLPMTLPRLSNNGVMCTPVYLGFYMASSEVKRKKSVYLCRKLTAREGSSPRENIFASLKCPLLKVIHYEVRLTKIPASGLMED